MIKIEVAAWSDRGQVRPTNEDRVFYQMLSASDADPIALCMIADGMGGYLGGEVASHWAIETLKLSLADLFVPNGSRRAVRMRDTSSGAAQAGDDGHARAPDMAIVHLLREAIRRANHIVRQYTIGDQQEAMGAGSTLTLVLVKGTRAYVANVGDSRAYLLRAGRLTQVTRDHSVVAELVAAGRVTLAESFTHPQGGLITRCVGCSEEIDPDIGPLTARVGDLFLLCSDGLWTMLRDPRAMAEMIAGSPDLESAAQALVSAANEAGGKDNVTVGLMRLAGAPDISA
ncbi:MAG: serine/threonine-protein phosphatase [Anaerolineae bacterium]|nr:serine/threonine-protein phosphatase [Anaerolineae bacterium]